MTNEPQHADAYRVAADHLAFLRQIVDEQAEDEGLWFIAQTAPEAYLQQGATAAPRRHRGGDMRLVGVPGGERARYNRWAKLCEDPTVCNSNAYFYVMEGIGSPAIDEDCRRDAEANGHCWCGKIVLDASDRSDVGDEHD